MNGKHFIARRVLLLLLIALLTGTFPSGISINAAPLSGTVFTAPGSTVFPGLVPPGTASGTELASLSDPGSFTTTAGTTSFTLDTAVFRNPSGTLDFYYQVANDSNSATSLARLTATNFSTFATYTGYRTDGATTLGAPFSNGTVPPVSADRNASGTVVGFDFQPPDSAKVAPGQTSEVLVISTDATNFGNGNVSVIDGGAATLPAFQPIPEPSITVLIALASILLLISYRRIA
jgi:hypothetical protein